MEDDEIERGICSLIRMDKRIRTILTTAPDVELIPFEGSRETFYLLLSLIISQKARDFISLSYTIRKAAALTVSLSKVKTLPGIEVVAYIETNKNALRVVRLVVYSEAFSHVEKLTDDDLLHDPLYPGIKCNWFVTKPENATDVIDLQRDT